ncbi:MAG TPA: serine/threonine-protein kinase [Kofleriaceae bacterium]|nr:serine/threonine-protein kinase [Kofleriaceae bacterium]
MGAIRDPLIGMRADRFALVRAIGAGGMGRVYVAEDDHGERVAVKTVLPELAASPAIRERFALEARASDAIAHPRVVQVLGTGRFDGGEPWLMMDLVDGADLWRRVKRDGPLAPRDALAILAQVCDGLHAAHRAGIVHRDLKPDHVVVDDRGAATIVDFGVAQVSDPGLPQIAHGDVVGSAGFMAPEQAGGGPVDRRADVFALGAVAYWTITGAPAFRGETIEEYVAEVARGRAPRFGAGVPAAWADAITRAVHRDPRERPASAIELATALADGVARGGAIVKAVAPSLFADAREVPTDKMPAQPKRGRRQTSARS